MLHAIKQLAKDIFFGMLMLENRQGQPQKLGGGASEGARTALEDVRPSSLLNRCIVRVAAWQVFFGDYQIFDTVMERDK